MLINRGREPLRWSRGCCWEHRTPWAARAMLAATGRAAGEVGEQWELALPDQSSPARGSHHYKDTKMLCSALLSSCALSPAPHLAPEQGLCFFASKWKFCWR